MRSDGIDTRGKNTLQRLTCAAPLIGPFTHRWTDLLSRPVAAFSPALLEVPVSIAAAGGMSGPSASASASAAAGSFFSNVFGWINHGGTQDDEQSRFCETFERLLTLHEQVVALQTQMGDTIRYLAAKGYVGESRLPMVEGAVSDISDALGPLTDGLRRLNGAALLEGHSKTFGLVTPDEQASAVAEKTTETTGTNKKVEVNSKRPRGDAPVESSGAAAPPLLPGLSLPTDVMRDIFLPFLTPHDSTALCRTSEAVSSTVEAALVADMDSIIQRDGLTGVIGYTPLNQSSHGSRLVRRLRLIRLHYMMVTGGDWRGTVPLLRLAKSCGRVQQLPVELTNDDLRLAGSKAVIDSRRKALRQYSLYSHRLGERMRLTRNAGGRDELGGGLVRVHTRQRAPAIYRHRFDAADPPCRYREFPAYGDAGLDYSSFRGLIIRRLAALSSREVTRHSGRRIGALMAQQPPLWGCRTIAYSTTDYGWSGFVTYRFVILCGAEEGDEFAAYIEMAKYNDGSASIELRTTAAPRGGVSGPAAFPQVVSVARSKMDGPSLKLLPDI
ncbi:unnamed protein product [Vitrella brassicaformis CCMP3155]|uniref:Uncharacterized protein n=2 Tax=Vitrella brassicaformis TaxID=1169539 RepID=A0A0G4EF83_VITBC|nr:unnamed protein product [Vitrella brassicaformis CCMP3155]|eukprot:CEL94395.1 unnamed protein product [Vitrella brassicaformis CCMP3155]